MFGAFIVDIPRRYVFSGLGLVGCISLAYLFSFYGSITLEMYLFHVVIKELMKINGILPSRWYNQMIVFVGASVLSFLFSRIWSLVSNRK